MTSRKLEAHYVRKVMTTTNRIYPMRWIPMIQADGGKIQSNLASTKPEWSSQEVRKIQ